jgi:hypothetical protein
MKIRNFCRPRRRCKKILKQILKKLNEIFMKLIRLAEDKDKRLSVMNMQIDIHKPLLHIISKLINYSYYKASMVNETNRAVTHWYHDY